MLFLGTKTYPREGDFEQYVGANGGSNNAFTDSEDTCYFFDIGGEALPGGLARFADFFVAPLFTESATGREVNAIQSEHDKNLQTDFWRFSQLLKLRARQDHPYSHFSTGNQRRCAAATRRRARRSSTSTSGTTARRRWSSRSSARSRSTSCRPPSRRTLLRFKTRRGRRRTTPTTRCPFRLTRQDRRRRPSSR